MAESEEELKSLMMKVKEASEKVGLKLNPLASSPPQQLCSSAPAGSGFPGRSRGQEVLCHSFLLPPSFLSFLPLSLPNFYFLTKLCIVKRVDDFYQVGRPAAPPPCLLTLSTTPVLS